MSNWLDKNYYSLNAYFKEVYGQKCYKIAVNAGLSCPNRDGKLDSRGCIFCSAGGSGDFAVMTEQTIDEQIEEGIARFNKSIGEKFVIYFQAYTNTYGDIDYLRRIWKRALEHPRVIGISIATRPDCLGDDVLELLRELQKEYCLSNELVENFNDSEKFVQGKNKFIWIELGLQTIHEKTASYIRRHYTLDVYNIAVEKLNKIGINYITHIILGLPGEDKEMMLETVKYVNKLKPFGVKLQLLHALSGTDLGKEYMQGRINILEMDDYIDIVIECLRHIDTKVVIHRVTGDGPKNILLAPTWSRNKKVVLNALHNKMRLGKIMQGDAL